MDGNGVGPGAGPVGETLALGASSAGLEGAALGRSSAVEDVQAPTIATSASAATRRLTAGIAPRSS
jgi:hypothetical protein